MFWIEICYETENKSQEKFLNASKVNIYCNISNTIIKNKANFICQIFDKFIRSANHDCENHSTVSSETRKSQDYLLKFVLLS